MKELWAIKSKNVNAAMYVDGTFIIVISILKNALDSF